MTSATDDARIFRLSANDWEAAANMAYSRFYPTCTTLSDGKILTVAGLDCAGQTVLTPEIYAPGPPGTWSELGVTTTGMAQFYPFMFLLPDGKVFYAGGGGQSEPNPSTETYTLDMQSNPPAWDPFPDPNNDSIFQGIHGAAVMYEPGKILKAGGQASINAPIEQRTARIDVTDPSPTWISLGAWNWPEARKDHYLVLLPDGKILLVGGTSATGAVFDARLWDPNAPEPVWVNMADMVKARGHHAVALLLPDGTVLAAGGSSDTAEIYEPPYLHTGGARPQISSAPSTIEHGTQFNVTATSIVGIDRVTLLRPGSVTHWFDSDQRFLELGFTNDVGNLLVNAPCSGNFAPPGHYMLFVLDNAGVPSVASWIQVIPNPCRPDLNDDNDVGPTDLAMLLAAWGPAPGHPADFDCDGEVGSADLAVLLAAWGPCGRGISSGTELIDALLEMGYANVEEHTAWSTAAPAADVFASGQQLLELLGE